MDIGTRKGPRRNRNKSRKRPRRNRHIPKRIQQDRFHSEQPGDIYHEEFLKQMNLQEITSSLLRVVAIPISFRALPSLLMDLWHRMDAGLRFDRMGTSDNLNIFMKCALTLAEAKVAFAQQIYMPMIPPTAAWTRDISEEQELRLKAMARFLPFPLSMYLQSIGSFKLDGQHVVPVLLRSSRSPDVFSGLLNFAPSELRETVRALEEFAPSTNELVVQAREVIEIFPEEAWEERGGHVKLTPQTVSFWNTIPTSEQWRTFCELIHRMSPTGLTNHDISLGTGTAAQAVRFKQKYTPPTHAAEYYINTQVPPKAENLGIAFQLGYEYGGDTFSRFCVSDEVLDINNSYKRGVGYPTANRLQLFQRYK